MATSRFPRQKYIRQLAVMADDCASWAMSYREAAHETTSEYLAGRFSGRAYVLHDIVHQLQQLQDAFAGVPRIS
jgi:hypothetical protein